MKLSEIVDALEMQSNEIKYYYNKRDKQLCFVMEYYSDDELSQKLIDDIDENPDDFIDLPNEYEIDDYQMMVDFAFAQNDENIQYVLIDILNRKKPFRNFKDKVLELDIRDEWFDYKNRKLEQIAKKWCERYGVSVDY